MHTKKRVPVLCVELYKSLYGLMRSALLFYRKLRGKLIEYGSEINPYDPCVANKMTKNGKQLTVLWHINDLEASCVEGYEVTKLFLYLKRIYGNKMTIDRNKKFEFLGMQLDYSEPEVFQVDMIPYIDTIINDWPEAITRGRSCPHNANLFKV